jgi:uncharacterized RDD family membrane protein YckC
MSAVNPYAPPASRVTHPDAAIETWTAAGAGRRLRAYVTDAVIMHLLMMPLTFVAFASVTHFGLFGFADRRGDSEDFMAFTVVGMLVLLVVVVLYHPLMESSRLRATAGKRGLGMRVVGLDGQRVTFLRARARHAVRLAPFIPWVAYPSAGTLLLTIGAIMASVAMAVGRGDKRTPHDLVSGTRVERRA